MVKIPSRRPTISGGDYQGDGNRWILIRCFNYESERSAELRQGEQHCCERPNMEVWAGPLAKQGLRNDAVATDGVRINHGQVAKDTNWWEVYDPAFVDFMADLSISAQQLTAICTIGAASWAR
jgi:hypothetical protein